MFVVVVKNEPFTQKYSLEFNTAVVVVVEVVVVVVVVVDCVCSVIHPGS